MLKNTITVTFWGAAQTVTGSMHLVEAGGMRVLLDCGLFQGPRAEARQRNRQFPFSPAEINAVILSHAHIDHCGNLPNLVRQGFSGPIYCTSATRDLMAVMLADSAKIQEEDAGYLNQRLERGESPIEPLYDRRHVHEAVKLAHGLAYDREFEIGSGMHVRFVDAGHLLGSAMVALSVRGNGSERHLTFTGDLGRRGLPILRDPAPVPPADLIISESTYGGREHPPVDLLEESLAEVVRRTYQRGGKLLVPAFSLGRTQAIVYFLHQLIQAKKIEPLPIFVDSPLASEATEVFRLHPECFDEETATLMEEHPDVFGQRLVRYVRSADESRELNHRRDPCLIIAASGMCETGRILHHFKHNIEDPKNTVLIIGYQAPNTLGRRFVDRKPDVRIHNKFYKLRAEVVVMNGFSGHADQSDFRAFLGPLANKTEKIRLVHGELENAEALADSLQQMGFRDVAIPKRGEQVQV